MRRVVAILGAIASALVVALAMSAYSGATEDQTSTAPDLPDASVSADIMMPTKSSRPGCEESNLCYVPGNITVDVGSTVVWENGDAAFHSVTSGVYGEPDGIFDSGYIDPGEQFVFVFEEAGLHEYYCTLHPWMRGTVDVG